MAEQKQHNDLDKTVYRFHNPDAVDQFELAADDAEKSGDKSDEKTSTTKAPTKSTSTTKEK